MEKYLDTKPPFLSVDDVSKILCVTPRTIRRLIKAGDLDAIRIGRLIRIPKDKH